MAKRLLIVVALTPLLTAVLTALLTAAPAHGQDYPPGDDESITISDTTLVPGQTFTITATGFASGAETTATFFSEPVVIARGTADGSGTVTLTATVPEDATLGTHTITVSGMGADGELLELSATVEVVAPGAGAGPDADAGADGDLPRTGRNTLPLTGIAAALLAIGGAIVLGARGRRGAAEAANAEAAPGSDD
jgi:hypothetical protein